MKNDNQTIEERIQDLVNIGTRNDFSVKYNTVVDLLKEDGEETVDSVIKTLEKEEE